MLTPYSDWRAGKFPKWAGQAGTLVLLPLAAGQVRAQDARQAAYAKVSPQVWEWAEVGYQETKSSALLQEQLRAAGIEPMALTDAGGSTDVADACTPLVGNRPPATSRFWPGPEPLYSRIRVTRQINDACGRHVAWPLPDRLLHRRGRHG